MPKKRGLAISPLIRLLSVDNVTQKWYADDRTASVNEAIHEPSSIKLYHQVIFSATMLKHPNANSLLKMRNAVKLRKSSKIQESL